ncbi:MAG: hypothetical protein OK455_04445 [Thaumarchaeota archaeon]|nr:hypothetical protein [Nitrososphaerota archaeon]
MDVKPTKGIKVNCNPTKEAIFGEDGVEVKKTSISVAEQRLGVLTGRTLAGFAEVEMEAMDGKKHWFPTDEMLTDKGERLVEEEIVIEVPADDEGDGAASEEEADEELATD